MAKYKIKLLKKEDAAEGTVSFYFEKPAEFNFKAGQFMELTLVNPPETDAEGNTRAYSIASAPSENNLMIATRMRDTAFKRVLKSAPPGAELEMEGPFGSFTLQNDASRPAAFLMGGIGITPARSIIIDAARRNLPHRIYLFYSNRRPEDAAFLEELAALEKQNHNYKFIGTMTEMPKSQKSWAGEKGYINQVMLAKYISDLTKPIYYTAGPPAMVSAMRKMLNAAGINDDGIRSEEFSGY